MNIIKLNAIDSTSLFLKDLAKKSKTENFTIAVADEQHAGKGQMNTTWFSEKGKNLLFTIYVDLKGLSLDLIPYINFLSSVEIRNVIVDVLGKNHKIKVKWPNDIMSYNEKICGILVENVVKKNKIDACFIGIGLNVNQIHFPSHLPKASSLTNIKGSELDRDILLVEIITALKEVLNVKYILNNLHLIKQQYLKDLYKINIPSMFIDNAGVTFMGKIVDVTDEGILMLEKEDEQLYSYAVKEIKLL